MVPPRCTVIHRLTSLLERLFLERLPVIPAMNKWVSTYPMLAWMTLGSALHGVMRRVWLQGVLELPGVMLDDDEDKEGDAANETEEAFRRLRSRRAKRIATWMRNETCQFWAFTTLFVTAPLAIMLGSYLREDQMYIPGRHRDGGNPWAAQQDQLAESPCNSAPTLASFFKNNMANLRGVQTEIAMLLDSAGPAYHFLRHAFAEVPEQSLVGALVGNMIPRINCHIAIPSRTHAPKPCTHAFAWACCQRARNTNPKLYH